ncbi:2-oxoglutarate dehydrogenase complex dihydrolipoyllysine-residue succinyltransferase [Pseudohongiella spirulinae]|uniref:Dihydrolipoyllysine-residue succinyltransferase component of 2-oxoglutarate dehydrogenase complex n=1 Tax=Pseudohongiella spirulinae TaxID=1249552 RepID=A0A0S2KDJ4_9GAMM|nr:2-oxoglutarate dehydrogenase complex dihydrolipoyllysine-residue succinyltransferase [Pseudohongiella spirulinae]ALO46148.1 dihydrolipoamide succinyltransferase [Pseudohongiella spirulinae]
MSIEIKAPQLPESVPDGTIASWHKKAGDAVKRDELLVDIETDKVVIEVVSPADGVLEKIIKDAGDTIVSNEVIATVKEGSAEAAQKSDTASKSEKSEESATPESDSSDDGDTPVLSPAAKKLAEEHGLNPGQISGSGKDGRVTKEDVLKAIEGADKKTASPAPQAQRSEVPVGDGSSGRVEERVPMSRLRAKVAERLLQASQSTAMLTTFNEVNMKPVMELRSRYKDQFEKAHEGVRLGFMSFFVRASVEALKRFPAVNASIDGNDIVYHGYQDIGVAVSSPRGLVVPVLRNADHMSLAQVEGKIKEYGNKAQDGKLSIDEMTGGTFTISNGGVFGSLLSTPILNPPQTAILGMHKIQERPMAVNGKVEILPMMYLALSYDHRMIDGKEAVQFLVTIKELLEDPARILLEI